MKRLLLLLACVAAQSVQACGLCIEDKVAAVYDHAAVSRALALKHPVAFFVFDGTLAGTEVERKVIQQMAISVHGVDAGSVRVSSELGSLAVAFDPARNSFATIERALQLKLNRRGLRLALVRGMGRPADPRAGSGA